MEGGGAESAYGNLTVIVAVWLAHLSPIKASASITITNEAPWKGDFRPRRPLKSD
jgi:hypothetical protein